MNPTYQDGPDLARQSSRVHAVGGHQAHAPLGHAVWQELAEVPGAAVVFERLRVDELGRELVEQHAARAGAVLVERDGFADHGERTAEARDAGAGGEARGIAEVAPRLALLGAARPRRP